MSVFFSPYKLPSWLLFANETIGDALRRGWDVKNKTEVVDSKGESVDRAVYQWGKASIPRAGMSIGEGVGVSSWKQKRRRLRRRKIRFSPNG
jgi:hypothetical protein